MSVYDWTHYWVSQYITWLLVLRQYFLYNSLSIIEIIFQIISAFLKYQKDVDDRGYYLVERWVLSIIQTENPAKVIGEGLTRIKNIGTLKEISESCPEKVFGNYLKSWPLIKVLDIGGDPVKTSFGTTEKPPIPPHIHAGRSSEFQ